MSTITERLSQIPRVDAARVLKISGPFVSQLVRRQRVPSMSVVARLVAHFDLDRGSIIRASLEEWYPEPFAEAEQARAEAAVTDLAAAS